MDRKHCGKRRNCSLQAISPLPTVFSKDLYFRHIKTRACFEKGLEVKQYFEDFDVLTIGKGILIHIDSVDCYCVTKQQMKAFHAFIEEVLRCVADPDTEQKVSVMVSVIL